MFSIYFYRFLLYCFFFFLFILLPVFQWFAAASKKPFNPWNVEEEKKKSSQTWFEFVIFSDFVSHFDFCWFLLLAHVRLHSCHRTLATHKFHTLSIQWENTQKNAHQILKLSDAFQSYLQFASLFFVQLVAMDFGFCYSVILDVSMSSWMIWIRFRFLLLLCEIIKESDIDWSVKRKVRRPNFIYAMTTEREPWTCSECEANAMASYTPQFQLNMMALAKLAKSILYVCVVFSSMPKFSLDYRLQRMQTTTLIYDFDG